MPVAFLNNDLFIANPDERRGIPVTFSIVDVEEDDVDFVLQWRFQGGAFPALPDSVEGLLALLSDPEEARKAQVCTQMKRTLGGTTGGAPAGINPALQLRLPDLASEAASLVASGLGGRTVEILRASSVPAVPVWASNPLSAPVAVLAGPLPQSAYVLDSAGAGSWRVREIELATGADISAPSPIATGMGAPTAMHQSPSGAVLFVASLVGAGWKVDRIELAGSTSSMSDPLGAGEAARGIAALSDSTALITAADSLWQIDFNQDAVVELIPNLSEPWGVAHDARTPNRVLVAERGADQVVEIDLLSRRVEPVTALVSPSEVGALGVVAFPSPTALTLEDDHRLLVATQPAGFGGSSLRSLDVNSPVDLDENSFADSHVVGIATLGAIGGITAGKEGLRVVALPTTSQLAVAGGVEQARQIVTTGAAYDASTQVVTVSAAFDPVPQGGTPWRIAFPPLEVKSSKTGAQATFLWDSSDALSGGLVNLRVVPLDKQIGIAGEGLTSKRILPPLSADPEPLSVGTILTPVAGLSDGEGCGAIADLDADGDLDLAMALSGLQADFCPCLPEEEGAVCLSYQTAPGVFGSFDRADDDTLSIVLPELQRPRGIAAGDVTGDGRVDLVTGNRGTNSITLLAQTGFQAYSLIDNEGAIGPNWVSLADLDADGDLDLATAEAFEPKRLIPQGFIQTYENTGPPDFLTLKELIPLPGDAIKGSRPRSVIGADADADGDVDLVAADELGHELVVIFLEGGLLDSLSELPGPDLFLMDGPRNTAAVDIDADGDLDLVAANASSVVSDPDAVGNLLVFKQTAPGAYAFDYLLGESSSTLAPRSVVAGDFNRDGLFDLVAANYFGDDVTPFMQRSIDVFDSNASIGDSGTDGPNPVLMADLNSDGEPDLVTTNLEEYTFDVFLGRKPGYFEIELTSTVGDAGTCFGTRSYAHGDLDGDGDLDLLSANRFGNDLSVFHQGGPGFYAPAGAFANGLDSPVSVEIADLDGDARLDVVAVSNGDVFFVAPDTRIFVQGSDGSFSDEGDFVLKAAADTFHDPLAAAIADVDGDGDLDVVVANQGMPDPSVGGRSLSVFRNDGGVFASEPIQTITGDGTLRPVDVVAADFDRDGLADLAAASKESNHVAVFLNQGDPGAPFDELLASQTVSLPGEQPTGLAAADLGGDAGFDLVVSTAAGGGQACVLVNSGGGFAVSPQGPLAGDPAASVAAADLDADGDQDFAVAVGAPADAVQVFFQVRPGVFAPDPAGAILLNPGDPTVFDPRVIRAADYDGDADVDLALSNAQADRLTILWGAH